MGFAAKQTSQAPTRPERSIASVFRSSIRVCPDRALRPHCTTLELSRFEAVGLRARREDAESEAPAPVTSPHPQGCDLTITAAFRFHRGSPLLDSYNPHRQSSTSAPSSETLNQNGD